MKNQDEFRNNYKDTILRLHAPEDLKEKIYELPDKNNKKHLSVLARAVVIAAAVILCVGISNLVTWAATGSPWIVSVSNDLFSSELEKMNEHYPGFDEEDFAGAKKVSAETESTSKSPAAAISEETEAEQTETEDIYSRLGIETYSAQEAETPDGYTPGDIVIKGDLTDEQLDALWENYEKIFQEELHRDCDEAVAKGYVYLFENILEYDESLGIPVHGYRFTRAFSEEELEGAQFSEDYEWLKIQGENYHVMVSHVGDFKELDENLPELDWEVRILRVFTEENYREKALIMTIEGLEAARKNLAVPVYEGRVAAYSNEDDSLLRTFTGEECHAAEISENFQVVRIAGELYMVTYELAQDDTNTIESIRLYPPSGYKGDAETENIEQMKFYTMEDFNLN